MWPMPMPWVAWSRCSSASNGDRKGWKADIADHNTLVRRFLRARDSPRARFFLAHSALFPWEEFTMRLTARHPSVLIAISTLLTAGSLSAAEKEATLQDLEGISIADTMFMMPMRDGVRLATDIYRPKNAAGKV